MLGCGVVGAATARILIDHARELETRAGVVIELAKVAVRDLAKDRSVGLSSETWTVDPSDVVNDPEIDVVVELIGGIEPARELILAAIRNGKHVVTANKELLAQLGPEVMIAAEDAGLDVLFEAAVGGGIPIIRPMKESLAGDRVHRVLGIVNGTTNFILTRMSETGVGFAEALAEADSLGYTESDPSADIDGFDAASKLAILASLAFGSRVVADDVHREGISKVSTDDIASAHDLGYEVKPLAVAEIQDGRVSASVHPAMVPKTHPLASVRDVFNAVFVEAEQVGELMFLGRGAGGGPTGSAVVGDLVEVARNIRAGAKGIGSSYYRSPADIRLQEEVPVRYYVLLSVADQPGVLAGVASVFARNGVSIASVRQEGSGDEATLMLITHTATDGAHSATFADLRAVEGVRAIESRMRVEGASEG